MKRIEELSAGQEPELVEHGQLLRYASELAQLQKLRRRYEHLLPDTLDPNSSDPPPPVVREATVLFTDIRGFTRLTEQLMDDPVQLLSLVNAHLVAVVNAVLRCGGVVEKFVGDGVFATFGARRESPDHALCALGGRMAALSANELVNRRRRPSRRSGLTLALA